jgi:predicted nucleic acid-binding protein
MIDEIHLLPQLFESVVIPSVIATELRAEGAPVQVRQWIEQTPTWLEIAPNPYTIPEVLQTLHSGEQAAIALVLERRADLLIVDEKAAREIAQRLGIRVTGVVGILKVAAKRQLIEPSQVVQKLRQTNFRVSNQLLQQLLDP